MTTTSYPTRAATRTRRPATPARMVFGLLRLAAAATALAAIITQISERVANGAFVPEWYFSYFTVQSSLISVVVLGVGAVLAFRWRSDPELFTAVRMSAVAYATVTCVVYNVLLRGLPDQGFVGLAWPGEVLHVWIPVFLIVEWVVAPGRAVLGWERIWTAVGFPLVWLGFTLVRGVLGRWYPYPFLEPDAPAGPVSVLVYIVVISAFIVGVAALAIGISRVGLRNRAG